MEASDHWELEKRVEDLEFKIELLVKVIVMTNPKLMKEFEQWKKDENK